MGGAVFLPPSTQDCMVQALSFPVTAVVSITHSVDFIPLLQTSPWVWPEATFAR
jgi:hypothetical protein